MKKVLVTGGLGYIGSHTVVNLVESGYTPIIVDNLSNSALEVLDALEELCQTKLAFYQEDLRNADAIDKILTKENVDAVIHFAAFKAVGESVSEPVKYYDNNIGSLLSLLDLMKKHEVKHIIFSSSCTVYGQPKDLPVTEASPYKTAESPYGYTKQVCETILADISKAQKDMNVVRLRYFNPIGAHHSALIGELPIGTPNNLVPFITQTAAGIHEQLTVFGNDYNTEDGSCVRDFIHVMDLAAAHVKSLDLILDNRASSNCISLNLGTGKGISVLEAISAFEKVSGRKLNYTIGERREGDIEQIFAATDYAEKTLDWKAKYGIEEAMQHAWNWQKRISNID